MMQQEHSRFNWQTIAAGIMAGRKRAMEESLRWNLPMVGWDGEKTIKITPDEIRQQLANYPTSF